MSPLTEKLLYCKVKGFSSLLVCFPFVFCRVMTFNRYKWGDFTFGLTLDCVRYNEDLVTSKFGISRFCFYTFYCNFGRAEEYRSLYRGLRYIEVSSISRASTVVTISR